MKEDNKDPNKKKGFPGGFWLFVLAGILVYLTMSSLSSEKQGKVSFSHQAEHLHNLDLVQKDQSKKVTINDQLVTFSGKFKTQLSDEAKARYRYLELLNQNHELNQSKNRFSDDLDALNSNVLAAGDTFLHLRGTPLPSSGYVIVDPVYNRPERQNAIVIHRLSNRSMLSLPKTWSTYQRVRGSMNPADIQVVGRDVQTLINSYRSPTLGIGNEEMKEQLKNLPTQVQDAGKLSSNEQMDVYRQALDTLSGITKKLDTQTQGVRLMQLRSVRNYVEDLNQYQLVTESLENNTALLDAARKTR